MSLAAPSDTIQSGLEPDKRSLVPYVRCDQLLVDKDFKVFVETEVLPDLSIDAGTFWQKLSALEKELAPHNRALIKIRDRLQAQIDQWHKTHEWDADAYRQFLIDIGYIAPRVGDFSLETTNVDSEIAELAGPQLVVPVKNPRFALNAANARWGSLFDALYGTDAIPQEGELVPGRKYNPVRGQAVIAEAKKLLDQHFPLVDGSHTQARRYFIEGKALTVEKDNGETTQLQNPSVWRAYTGSPQAPASLLFQHHGLHLELIIDRESDVGRDDPAGIADILLESALTTIMDCEDSVAAVDAEDKIDVYRNWLGLMRGDLSVSFTKKGKRVSRELKGDREYLAADGESIVLPGRALMLVRNVGHLMTTPTVLDSEGREVFEGLLDMVMTSCIALYDLRGLGRYKNSRRGSVYIVKPKMHGPLEVAFAVRMCEGVERLLELPHATLKLGIMDEERRTTINLKASIKQARERCVFINTGFLDRTGDEIHTSMYAGPMVAKSDMKAQAWISAYEQWNVDIGLGCGFSGRAQIGKGMWPMPDEMHAMRETKIAHPKAGASTAWVPSPTAATLHAIHYHQIDVAQQQAQHMSRLERDGEQCFDELLKIPLLIDRKALSAEKIREEIDNNCQGILGYVVRWIDQGVGCSKVPDIHNIGLMEDRATLRISSQHLANWLLHDICSPEQVESSLCRMAEVVDGQNAGDPDYQPMCPAFDRSVAFKAAHALIFEGAEQPSGYTEPLLHRYRQQKKAQNAAR